MPRKKNKANQNVILQVLPVGVVNQIEAAERVLSLHKFSL
jgi:hypothetical protein